jgi:hypothetical protein
MKIMKLTITLLLCLLPSLVLAGTAHYVNCNASQNGNGSYASPCNNISSVNNHSFSTGDDVYFKVNTTCTPSTYLKVDWSGTSGDRVIIGAYYGNGQFGLNGRSRPIIDGNNNTVPSFSVHRGLIDFMKPSVSHVTVENLKIQYSGRYGVSVRRSDNINVDNCYIYRPAGNCILYSSGSGDGVDTGIISNNICGNSGYPDYDGVGAAIEITSGDYEGSTTNITVTRNKVFSSKQEGIGIYKKATNCIVEYNTVYDIKTAHIYLASSKYNIVRYNLVYNFDGVFLSKGYGISVSQEEAREYCYGGSNQIYNNLIAGQQVGISIGCGYKNKDPNCICHEDTNVYNNTLVDNIWNFRDWNPDSRDSIKLKNNISWTITGGTAHTNNYSPAGVTWSHNLFDDPVSGNAATDAVIGGPALKKASGWRLLSADSLDGTEFSLLSGSKAINAGKSITSYNNRITASDYTADTIIVMKSIDSSPDIGAWMNTNSAAGILPSPRDLTIIGVQ